MGTSISEIEWKYDIPAEAGLPRLDDLPRVAEVRGPEHQQLEAEYFDTSDLRLIRAGITLRRRRGGRDAGWHLKLPAGAAGSGERREIQVPLTAAQRAVPGELAYLVLAHARGKALKRVVTMSTSRQVLVLAGHSGESLAEVVTDDVSARLAGGAGQDTRWREVEVELTGGDGALLRAADEVLRQAGLVRSGRSAKLQRALGLESAEPAARAQFTPRSPAGQVVLAYLAGQAAVLRSFDPLVREDEPDAVHQMRVATRRLRAAIGSFASLLPADAAAHLDRELKWLAGLLGEARDAEVLTAHLQTGLDRTPADLVVGQVAARIGEHFAPRIETARADVLAALGSRRYLRLLDELDALISGPLAAQAAAEPAGAVLPAAVGRPGRQALKRMRRAAGARGTENRNAALHQARKAAKRARYAAEAVTPAIGKQAGRFAKRMKALQSVLGDHQDTVIARSAIKGLAMEAHEAGENAFSYGLLYQHDAQAAQALQDRAARVWKRAARPKYRRWMT